MNSWLKTFEVACQRARIEQLPYAGAVMPNEAYMLIQNNLEVQLIDVRTRAERDWVGRVSISPKQEHSIEWNVYPENIPNPDFLNQLAKVVNQDTILLFLCRSGVRSKKAAQRATEAGYKYCFDILEGFEGDKDSEGHRKMIGGWCHAGLPWINS